MPDINLTYTTTFDRIFNDAARKLTELVSGSNKLTRKGYWNRLKINRLIKVFDTCLQVNPRHWESMFSLGKAHQYLGAHTLALTWLAKALNIQPNNPYLLLEISIQQVYLNDISQAILYTEKALQELPGDPVILGNLAMNYLVAGKDQEAIATIATALSILPENQINLDIQAIITAVIAGKRHRPICQELIDR
ncbi:tetratricopeptide repeat protein [Chitinophaga sp. 30R24]|uniref:tetratricopeptide repeat protein n=1 Tax=Chitinophaga sp. 30R24 TaxID=3248838 RepID=UPI003B8F81CE